MLKMIVLPRRLGTNIGKALKKRCVYSIFLQIREQISSLLRVNSTTPETFHGFLYADGLSNTVRLFVFETALRHENCTRSS
jgi:hypothetical protein